VRDTDEIKEKKSKVKKENVKNKSSIKDCSASDEQVSMFKAEVGNEEKTLIIP